MQKGKKENEGEEYDIFSSRKIPYRARKTFFIFYFFLQKKKKDNDEDED